MKRSFWRPREDRDCTMIYLPVSYLQYPLSWLHVWDVYQARRLRDHSHRYVSIFTPHRVQICKDLFWWRTGTMKVCHDVVFLELRGLQKHGSWRLNHRRSIFEKSRVRDISEISERRLESLDIRRSGGCRSWGLVRRNLQLWIERRVCKRTSFAVKDFFSGSAVGGSPEEDIDLEIMWTTECFLGHRREDSERCDSAETLIALFVASLWVLGILAQKQPNIQILISDKLVNNLWFPSYVSET